MIRPCIHCGQDIRCLDYETRPECAVPCTREQRAAKLAEPVASIIAKMDARLMYAIDNGITRLLRAEAKDSAKTTNKRPNASASRQKSGNHSMPPGRAEAATETRGRSSGSAPTGGLPPGLYQHDPDIWARVKP